MEFDKDGDDYQHFMTTANSLTPKVLDDFINKRLSSIPKLQAQYLKFTMRRNTVACLENSVLSTRSTATKSFALNYISVTGYDVGKNKHLQVVDQI